MYEDDDCDNVPTHADVSKQIWTKLKAIVDACLLENNRLLQVEDDEEIAKAVYAKLGIPDLFCLFNKIQVPEFCPSLDEDGVCKVAYELIFAFDEVISLGHKENVTVTDVKQYIEMESHEEKLHNMIVQSKINETKDIMKRKASEIDKIKLERLKMDKGTFIPSTTSGPLRFDSNGFSDLSSSGGGGFGSNIGFGSSIDFDAYKPKARTSSLPTPAKGLGMQLGKGQKTNQILQSLKAEGEMYVDEVLPNSGPSKAAAVALDPIVIALEENLAVILKKDGGLESFEVRGTMSLLIQNQDDTQLQVQIANGSNQDFQFKTHPLIDKKLYLDENILALKDSTKSFQAGTPSGILKWRLQSKQESLVPLNINCWPSISGRESIVNIEYEASRAFELQNVVVSIPLPALRDPPVVNQVDGDWRYDIRKSTLEWNIFLIDDTNRSGSMEFVVPAADSSAFFPIDVKFTASTIYCDIKVLAVVPSNGQGTLKYSGSHQLVVDSYQVV
ncbi:hypothetical protein L7F22_001539 [Adiantum nelumboides]|nr:hypothetical protein [Adiantum nelumboides]